MSITATRAAPRLAAQGGSPAPVEEPVPDNAPREEPVPSDPAPAPQTPPAARATAAAA